MYGEQHAMPRLHTTYNIIEHLLVYACSTYSVYIIYSIFLFHACTNFMNCPEGKASEVHKLCLVRFFQYKFD